MHGIDISMWQDGINIPSIAPEIDFCIVKATEGLGYTDPCCDGFVQQLKSYGKLWGFYHFARENEPETEAEYFYNECRNYFNDGIPVLDYETENYDNCEWCERFLNRLHELSGVWAIIYISAYRVSQYEGSWIPSTCGLWIAGYPYDATYYDSQDLPYDVAPWEFAAMWQFTSNLYLSGYDGRLDGNYAYMDAEAWKKYAQSTIDGTEPTEPIPPVQPEKDYIALAKEIMMGKWGNGAERFYRLTVAGYNAKKAQDLIDEYYELAHDIWLGKWGNGWNRKTALEGAGYDYDLAQMIVDSMLLDNFEGC